MSAAKPVIDFILSQSCYKMNDVKSWTNETQTRNSRVIFWTTNYVAAKNGLNFKLGVKDEIIVTLRVLEEMRRKECI